MYGIPTNVKRLGRETYHYCRDAGPSCMETEALKPGFLNAQTTACLRPFVIAPSPLLETI
jgi:hypothetical protein